MAKSSINIKPSSANAVIHNERVFDVAYAIDSESRNEYKTIANIKGIEHDIYADYLKHHGRRLNTKATPIREAVINLNENHTMTDVENLCSILQQAFKIQPLHIAIHRDEGHKNANGDNVYNFHAHVIFNNYDFVTHRSIKLDKFDMSKMQTIVAQQLQMERGELGSKSVRLEHREYKRAMQEVSSAVTLTNSELMKELQPLEDLNSKYFNAKTVNELAISIENKLKELERVYKQNRELMKESKQAKQTDYQALKAEYNALVIDIKSNINDELSNVFNKGFQSYQNLLERKNTSFIQKQALKTLELPQGTLHTTIISENLWQKIETALTVKQAIEEVPIKKEVIHDVPKYVEKPVIIDVDVNIQFKEELQKKAEMITTLQSTVQNLNKTIITTQKTAQESKKEQTDRLAYMEDSLNALECENTILKSDLETEKSKNRKLEIEKTLINGETKVLETRSNALSDAIERFLELPTYKELSNRWHAPLDRLNDVIEHFKRLDTKEVLLNQHQDIEIPEVEQQAYRRRR